MKITQGMAVRKKARIYKNLMNKDIFKVGSKKYKLSADIKQLRVLNKEEYRSFVELFLIIIISLTIVGLIIGIPWLIVSKRIKATVSIETVGGDKYTGIADKKEWKILSNYITA